MTPIQIQMAGSDASAHGAALAHPLALATM
jgi:hypothetical protein